MKSDFQGKWYDAWNNEKNPKLTGSFVSWLCAELDKREARDAKIREKVKEAPGFFQRNSPQIKREVNVILERLLSAE